MSNDDDSVPHIFHPFCTFISFLPSLHLSTFQTVFLTRRIIISLTLSFCLPLQVKTVLHPIILVYYSLYLHLLLSFPLHFFPICFMIVSLFYMSHSPLRLLRSITLTQFLYSCAVTSLSLSHFILLLCF